MGFMDMLGRFFKNGQNNCSTGRSWAGHKGYAEQGVKWRFKRHAIHPFWRWVCSWARAMRRPSDMGFDDAGFALPPLIEQETVVPCSRPRNGMLFVAPATCLKEQREEQRMTVKERCEMAAEKVDHADPAVLWCHRNDEGDLLEKLIPGSVQVSGSMEDDAKAEAFQSFSDGSIRVLITKPRIGGFGLNWQHCNHMVVFPSHSYEQYYQSVRRCWRFGQERPVTVDIITTEGEQAVLKNLQRKAEQADVMFSELVSHMNDELAIRRVNTFTQEEEVPSWL
jgi:hypothetical protein